jgi:hypothetical protein
MTVITAAQHAEREKKLKAHCKKQIADQHEKTQRAKEREKTAKSTKSAPAKKTRKKRTPVMSDKMRATIAASPRTINPAEPMLPAPAAAPSLVPSVTKGGRTRHRMRW